MYISAQILVVGALLLAGSASARHGLPYHLEQFHYQGHHQGLGPNLAKRPQPQIPPPISLKSTSEVPGPSVTSTAYTSSSIIPSSHASATSSAASARQTHCSQPSAYGTVIDSISPIPSNGTKPSSLPLRADGNFTVTGDYSAPFTGLPGGEYLMFYNGQNVTLSGTGYFQVRWEVAWFNRGGVMVMPTWTGLEGQLYHVASGGGRVMTDKHPGTNCTWMGVGCDFEVITLPQGTLQIWQNEFYWLDGTVTLHENEESADYNLGVTPVTWEEVNEDINGKLDVADSILRYGWTRDTGDYCGPVPQHVTNNATMSRYRVRQKSQVSFL